MRNLYLVSDLIVFLIGIIFGSFFNVCIYRIPKGKSIVYGRSHCGSCNKGLKFYELVPIFSWLFLRGKCKECKKKISYQYPLVEFITGIIYIFIFLKFGFSIDTIKYMVLFSVILIAAIIDLKTKEVYFNVSLTGLILGIVFTVIDLYYGRGYLSVVVSILIPLISLGIIYLLTKSFDGIGLGDIEMLLVISLYINPMHMILSVFFSIILGGIVSVFYLIKGERGKRIPFVPFIALGTFVSVFFGLALFKLYLGLF